MITSENQQKAIHSKQEYGLRLPCLTSVFVVLLLHQEPHRGAEAAGHVGPAVLANQGQVQGGRVPRRRAQVARPLLRVTISPSRRQLALPEEAHSRPTSGAVLPGAGGGAAWRGGTKDYRKGHKMKGLCMYAGFHDLEDAV